MSLNQKIRTEIEKTGKILIASHQNPEGDALGAGLALYHHFRKNKKIQVFNQDPIPYFLAFLPGADKIIHRLDRIQTDFKLVIAVDCTDLERVSEKFPAFVQGKRIINIDHHETNKRFGALNLVHAKASSTGEIIFKLLAGSGKKISKEIATCLYTAVMMDTGSFRYSNTTSATLEVASQLVALGAKPGEIAKQVYENQPRNWLKLLSLVLQSFNLSETGERAELTLNQGMLNKTGAGKEMSEGMINYLMMISGVEVGILYRQLDKNKYKVSFRSRGKINVAKLSESLGGGGHAQAAGATMNGGLEEIKKLVRARVDQLLAQKGK